MSWRHRRRRGAAQGVVARIDWARFLPLYQQAGRRAFLAELEREVPDVAPVVTASGKTQLVERLAGASVQQRKKLLTDYLRDAVAEVTRVDAAEIREDAGFFDLGMDSLMAVELRRHIEQGVGKEIPATLAMDHPRLSDVVDYLLSDVLGLSEQAAAKSGPQLASLATTRTDEPIAIVAVSCSFPGAPDPEAFWEVLSGGVDAIREVPEDRFDIDEFYDPDPDARARFTAASADSSTESTDSIRRTLQHLPARGGVDEPQQRLMLETAWEGLERAGYSRRRCAAAEPASSWVWQPTSMHICCPPSQSTKSCRTSSPAMRSMPFPVGSFALGLEGPAVAVDTACSSSLVAVHQAVQALHSGDCDLALAGGVNVLLTPITIIAASRADAVSGRSMQDL